MRSTPGPDRSPWCVYILRCRDGTLYTGMTNDLARRLIRHASGKASRYTRSRRPVALVYTEPATDRGAALRREAALKKLGRTEKLALIRARRARPAPVGGPRRTSGRTSGRPAAVRGLLERAARTARARGAPPDSRKRPM